ncbi:MAG: GIY-YIG nuclease family protein [Candidatus Omnitrophica bacterium]|nr:GIY-YIG nuclease family protein [Candidatus Omnitrophota bacterium]
MNPAPPKFYYVYMLRSPQTKWLYTGCTSDLKKRLAEHNSGKNYSTKKYLPVELVYYEAYSSKKDAFERENMLKQHGSSVQKLKNRLKWTLKPLLKEGGAG